MATQTTTAPEQVKSTPTPAERLVSLDIFRGIVIAFMILVNDPGDGPSSYWPLKHAEWNGWTPTDLVFPSFLFIVGVAMAFSFRSRMAAGQTRSTLLKHAAWRGIVLFGTGLVLDGHESRPPCSDYSPASG